MMGLGLHEVNRFLFWVKTAGIIIISGLSIIAAEGQTPDSSSVCPGTYSFHRPTFLIPPALSVTAGILVQNRIGIPLSSLSVKTYSRDLFDGRRTHVDDYLQFAPALAVGGLQGCGIRGQHRLTDELMLYAVSMGIQASFVLPLKAITREERPDGSARNSMPSGHTASAFAAATFMHMEYKHLSPWYGVAAYGCASAVGAMRIVNNRHWLSDVLVGAGIGIVSTRLSYYLMHKFRPARRRIGFCS